MGDNLFDAPPSPPQKGAAYDAASIQVLEDMEHVRLRPGMYIGGTDERALHHMAAEVIDNSMDEAIAGHADWIEIELHDNFHLTVRDNGRGIPIDPHPKFPDKSALEIIFCTLNAGGKFTGDAYQTSGGLHGVGASVVNALSDHLRVEVARNRTLYAMDFSCGEPLGALQNLGPINNRRGTAVTFHPDPQIFTDSTQMKAKRLYEMAKSKAYLYSGMEIRWKAAQACLVDDTPAEARFHFPNGLRTYLEERLDGLTCYSEIAFAGRVDFAEKFDDGQVGSVEWAINWTPARDGFTQSYCNTVPTGEGGTHESGFWAAILKGLKAYGAFVNNKKAAKITREDVMGGGCALVSCFIRDPKFVGQTKDRLATVEATRLVETSIRDHFDTWLAGNNRFADAILNFMVLRAEERLQKRYDKETARKTATKKLRLPGKLVDCSDNAKAGTELFIVEGDSAGGSAKMARNRKNQALLPLRGKILNVLGAAANKLTTNNEISDLCQALGVLMGTRFDLDDLRYEKIIIMTDADVDGAHIASLLMTFFFTQMRPLVDSGHLYLACPPLFRLSQGAARAYCMNEAERDGLLDVGIGGKGKIDISRFKGLGEMDAKDLKETTMHPDTRRLIQITTGGVAGEDEGLVERLMGKKAEHRFQYIQENAQFVTEIDI